MAIQLWRRPAAALTTASALAIGNFDGIHLGHQLILQHTRTYAQQHNLCSCLLTFEPYPHVLLHQQISYARLTSLREKIGLLEQLDIQQLYALPFNRHLAELSAQQFIEEILIKQLQARHVIVGEDFRFGCQRQGDIALLQSVPQFETTVVPSVQHQGERVSSTRIRQALKNSDLALAAALLGRPYQMLGRVVRGDQRGRQLGFPTANIALHRRIAPISGVFVVKVRGIDSQTYYGVANIGLRPTIGGNTPYLEIYLFEFSKQIYGARLTVEFLHKLRDEQRFASLEALKAQIARDVAQAQTWLRACD